MKRQIRCKGAHVRIAGEMTIYTAAAVHTELLKAINKRQDSQVLDLSEVTEFDTAGLQIVLVARRMAASLGRELRLGHVSPAVAEALELLQLENLIAGATEASA